ncbi:mono- and diacylglycerol lipase precursor, putative [Perkinsus marinus ATCC 50983]|uniref:sn-1-specific diacylglycerol lipase n=1 Tax=Perkinsus marinus (strain ATCC 50983 / TXsc) TaxID=423536 RepID=C5L3H6_PERM5|nr:mono- and diacylglycerol lipase precursor, putative [Perkinsus marinus ATCC 50983]EER08555.1 mono- and diacylglycerol lipase precursor, putative [Perkinsus marinus ATCC 50983]|eukprot:XP_002776739.1 mono- and diacylglycerol lipase precursor, putative [Perkinsus marinus ATCC 50983]
METTANLSVIESILRSLLTRVGSGSMTVSELLRYLIRVCQVGSNQLSKPDFHQHGAPVTLDNYSEVHSYMQAASAAYGAVFLNALGLEKIANYSRLDEPLDVSCITSHCPNIREVVCLSQSDGANQPVYFMAIDTEGTLILSIRGTASIADTITDLMCDIAPLTQGDKEWKVHRGIGTAARNVVSSALPRVMELMRRGDCKRLVVTGHSLGAGTAILVSILMARELPYVVDCYAFAPPPVSTTASPRLPSGLRLHSFVNGDDIVPRLSLRGAEDLLDVVRVPSPEDSDVANADKLYIPGKVYILEPDSVWETDGGNPALGPEAMVYYCQRLCGSPFGSRLDASKCLFDHFPDFYESKLDHLVQLRSPDDE